MTDQAEIHRKANSSRLEDRRGAAELLKDAFSKLPDKSQAWQDLHRLTQDLYSDVRWSAARTLSSVFVHVPAKDEAWQDLVHLTHDQYINVRREAVEALGSAFVHVPDKDRAWQDLHGLTRSLDSSARFCAAEAIGSAIAHVPDKSLAWLDLVRLTQDRNSSVRWKATEALGSAFVHVPDKSQAWQDLVSLSLDEDKDVRMYAYHSLGRASVLKATEADNRDCLLNEIKAAISYFEKSSLESGFGPSRFCLPFYRSYFAITFQGAKEDEVKRYLNEAKIAVDSSDSKAELIEAVENLAMALQESQCLNDSSIQEISCELNVLRWYCEKAAEHMASAEDKAPGAVKLMRKCTPLLEERIQATIIEIQRSARQICQATRDSGTEYEAPGADLQRAAKGLSTGDLISIQKCSSRIVRQLKKFCKLLPDEDKRPVCDIIEEIEHEAEFPEKLHKIETALLYLGPLLEDKSPASADVVILTVLPEEYDRICNQISELGPPPDMGLTPNLYAWQFGNVSCSKFNCSYKVTVGMIGRAGTTQGALAAREAVQLWRPRYVFFSGIAGGLPDPKEVEARPK